MTLDNFVTIAPGSRNLSILNGDGHIATVSPVIAGMFPLGGRFEGHPDNTIWIATGLIASSITWVDPGVPWRLAGQAYVFDTSAPVLTIPAGIRIHADPGSSFEIATLGRGSLVVGDATGPPVVIEATGASWGGITLGGGAQPSSLTRVELSRCGTTHSACLFVDGGSGNGGRVRMQDVTIRDAPGIGMGLSGEARFDPGSANLTITGSAGVPIELPANAVPSLPSGSYTQNGIDAIRLWNAGVTRTMSWGDMGLPYWAPFGLDIGGEDDPILTLQPGVVVRMGPATRVAIGSVLKAVGNAAAPVRFVSETPGLPGSWIGIELGLTADARTRLDHVTIEDAGAGAAGLTGAVRFQHDPGGVLRNTTILRSPTCGLMLFAGPWAEDYTDPLFGNSFIGIAGPVRCVLPP
jgi:hypothetical protein